MIKVALLTTDSREHFKDYANPNPYFGTAPEALIEGFKVLSGEIEVHIISCLQRKPPTSPPKLADNVYYHGLCVPSAGWMKTAYQGCVRAVRRKLRDIQPQIVHGQGTERDCAVSAVLSGYPNVVTVHGNMARIAKAIRANPLTYYWLAKHLERWCLRHTDGVVAISSYTKENVRPYAERTWLVHNAVHARFFRTENSKTKKNRILCAANISLWKNQIALIEALDALHKELEFELRFAGGMTPDDPYSRKFSRMIAEREWCSHLGSINREDLLKEFSCSSAVILPSVEENCPMVILEAAAAGVPVVASHVGGIPDLIRNGETGLLFDPLSGAAIREATKRILTDQPLAGRVSAKAQAEAQNRFHPRVVAKRHLDIYRQIAKAV